MRSVHFTRRIDPVKITAYYRNGTLRITASYLAWRHWPAIWARLHEVLTTPHSRLLVAGEAQPQRYAQ